MTKKVQQSLIFMALIFGGLVFVYYSYLLTPMKTRYKNEVKSLSQAYTRLSEMQRRARELPKLQAEMAQLEKEVEGLEKLLPKDKEVPELLRMITKVAQRYQLKVTAFSPLPPSTKQTNYNEIPFQMSVHGNYHALALFLAELGQEPRILSVRNITFNSFASTKENPQTISVNFILVAYTFKG